MRLKGIVSESSRTMLMVGIFRNMMPKSLSLSGKQRVHNSVIVNKMIFYLAILLLLFFEVLTVQKRENTTDRQEQIDHPNT